MATPKAYLSGAGRGENAQVTSAPSPATVSWRRPHDLENLLPAASALAAAAVLQYLLPTTFHAIGPHWIVTAIEGVLLIVLVIVELLPQDVNLWRAASVLVSLVTLDNTASSAVLVWRIIAGSAGGSATPLLAGGGGIWVTNVLVYGLWYWMIDRGGPYDRAAGITATPDFAFPQMLSPELASPHWHPRLLDYLYVSFTNATAFSPTDTMPMTLRAKALMTAQSVVALATVALVLARAVNIL